MLDETYYADLRIWSLGTTSNKPFTNRIYDNPEYRLQNLMCFQIMTYPSGKTHNPLTVSYPWQEVVYQMSGCFYHSTLVAAWTNTSSLTAERDEQILIAAIAMGTGKAFS